MIAPRTSPSVYLCQLPGHTCVPTAFATCASCSPRGPRTRRSDHDRPVPVLRQPFSPACPWCVLPDPCNPTIIHTEGGREANRGFAYSQHRGQFVAHRLNHLLRPAKAAASPARHRLLPNIRQKLVRDSNVHVAFQTAARESPPAPRPVLLVSFPCPRKFLNVRCSFPSNSQTYPPFPSRNSIVAKVANGAERREQC